MNEHEDPILYGSFPKQGTPIYIPNAIIILMIGTPQKVLLILGNP